MPSARPEALARISLSSSLAPFTEGETELELEVMNVRQLFDALGERYPKLQVQLETGVAVAIDGEIYQDSLLQTIPGQSEVFLFPKIAGG
jgi:molybdopterin synthase sulfur carrier subunit